MVSELDLRGIHDDATLGALRKVPRHRFVPEEIANLAYRNAALPIGHGQTISQPYIVALMTEAARIHRETKVLEVGTGSGYQTAVAAELSDRVFSIEIVPELAEHAAQTLRATGYSSVHLRVGDGYDGWPEEAPFDAMLVTAAAPAIPPPLIAQLCEGGRMVIPVGAPDGAQELLLLIKERGQVKTRSLLPVVFVPFTRAKK